LLRSAQGSALRRENDRDPGGPTDLQFSPQNGQPAGPHDAVVRLPFASALPWAERTNDPSGRLPGASRGEARDWKSGVASIARGRKVCAAKTFGDGAVSRGHGTGPRRADAALEAWRVEKNFISYD